MTDELQNDEYVEVTDDLDNQDVDLEQQQGAESDPASEPQHEEHSEGDGQRDVNQEAVNAAIAKQHAKYREEQRKNQELQQQLAQLQQQSVEQAPSVPDIPDRFNFDTDAEYHEAIKQRDEAIVERQAWQQNQQQLQAHQNQYQQQQQLAEQQRQAEVAQSYAKRVTELKVDQNELAQAAQTVAAYGVGQEVANYIMNDDKGPLLTTHLAKNPALLSEVVNMPPVQAILHIERNVRSKLDTKPRASKSTPPPKRVQGTAPDIKDKYPLTGGATVE